MLDNYQMRELSISLAQSEKEIDAFYELYIDAFKNEPDEIFSKQEVINWISDTRKWTSTNIYLLNLNNATVGFIILFCKDNIANIPWAGIKSEYQGKGLYPDFFKLLQNSVLKNLQIDIVLRECDNPKVLEGDLQKFAQKRLGLFRNKLNGKFYVNNEFVYYRPEPKNSTSRSYKYLFGFTLINPIPTLEIHENRISKQSFKKLIQYRQLFDCGIFSVEDQSKSSCVMKDFYNDLDMLKSEYLTIE